MGAFSVIWQSSSPSPAPWDKAAGVRRTRRAGLGQSWLCAQPVGSTLCSPGCQGCAGAPVRLFLQRSLVPARPCPCCCEIRGSPAFPSVTSIGPLCPWVLFAFLSRGRAGETLPAGPRLLSDSPRCAPAVCFSGKRKSRSCRGGPQLVVAGCFFPLFKM